MQEQLDSSSTHTNALGSQNKEACFKRMELVGTPFNVINDGIEWFIIFADTMVSEKFPSGTKTDDEIMEYANAVLRAEMWWVIMRIAGIIQHKVAMEGVKLMQQG